MLAIVVRLIAELTFVYARLPKNALILKSSSICRFIIISQEFIVYVLEAQAKATTAHRTIHRRHNESTTVQGFHVCIVCLHGTRVPIERCTYAAIIHIFMHRRYMQQRYIINNNYNKNKSSSSTNDGKQEMRMNNKECISKLHSLTDCVALHIHRSKHDTSHTMMLMMKT